MDDDISFSNGKQSLFLDFSENVIRRVGIKASRVDDYEVIVFPLRLKIVSVQRNPWIVLNNCSVCFRHPVEERGFPDIRSADNDNKRNRHTY